MGKNDHRGLEQELRSTRSEPRDEFVESVTRSVGRQGFAAPRRVAAVAVLTTFLLGSLALVGGFGSAAAGASSVADTVKKAVAPGKAVGKLTVVQKSPSTDQYEEKCNSGRGNKSEGDDSQLLYPGTDTGPGIDPTVDCDPGNSGAVNKGGD
jgi:hypothetical protein